MTRIWSRGWSVGRLMVLGVSVGGSLAFGLLAGCVTEPELKPPARPSPEQETQTIVDAVRKAGEAPGDLGKILENAAEAAFTQTFGPSNDAVMTKRDVCSAGGCLFEVIYRDQCAQIAFKQQFTANVLARLREWPGPIYRTPPIKLPDGRIRMTWALLLADAPAHRVRLQALLDAPKKQPDALRPDVCVNPGPAGGPAGVKGPTPLQGATK